MAQAHTAVKPLVWVRDEGGNTWLCPKESLRDPKHVSEQELRECVEESSNPQND
jgi:hypothetical protein